MKILLEVDVAREEGPTVSEDVVGDELATQIESQGTIYPQDPDKDDESSYEIRSAAYVWVDGLSRLITKYRKSMDESLTPDEASILESAAKILAELAKL